MSMDAQTRACKTCGYKVVFQDISDAHSPGEARFLDPPRRGDDVRNWSAVEKCPGCQSQLSPETTTRIESK